MALHCATANNTPASATACDLWRQRNALGGAFLPPQLQLRIRNNGTDQLAHSDFALDVAEFVTPPAQSVADRLHGTLDEPKGQWLCLGSSPGSTAHFDECGLSTLDEQPTATESHGPRHSGGPCGDVVTYELDSVVSYIDDHTDPHAGHHVAHIRLHPTALGLLNENGTKCEAAADGIGDTDLSTPAERSTAESAALHHRWLMVNDFALSETNMNDARSFHQEWKFPCIVVFRQVTRAGANRRPPQHAKPTRISTSVFSLPSLSHLTSDRPPLVDGKNLPARGSAIAIDTEFVAVAVEDKVLDRDGTHRVTQEARQALARISAVDATTGSVVIDDYILQTEPVVDFKTRFSGLTQADLDPLTSVHNLVQLRTAYLKLRLLVDNGCTFVGHGLRGDFRVVNMFVPPAQIADTVDLWSLPDRRKMSLRFLVACLLETTIQGETHDSIEDARSALALYQRFLEIDQQPGAVEMTLNRLYEFGRESDWKCVASKPFCLNMPAPAAPPPPSSSTLE